VSALPLQRLRRQRWRRLLSHDQHRLRRHFVVDQWRAEIGRASVGAASWCMPFGNLFGDPNAVLHYMPRPIARVLAFPGCFRGEIAQIRSELDELKRTIWVGALR
jgi:hypothetical protein